MGTVLGMSVAVDLVNDTPRIRFIEPRPSPPTLMLTINGQKVQVWIDFPNPTKEEIQDVKDMVWVRIESRQS
jgi:hypothetical protein